MSLGSGAVADSSQSGFQQYALADVMNCAKIPNNISDDEAATFPTKVSAAFVALFDVLGLPAPWDDDKPRPDHILIVGGGSNCGKFAVQLAKLAKIPNILIVGGNESLLKRPDATQGFDRHSAEDALIDKIRKAAGDGLHYALDAVSLPEGLSLALKVLSNYRVGKVARLLPVGSVEDTRGHELLDVLGLFLYRNLLYVSFWEQLTGYVEAGAIVQISCSTKEGLDADAVSAALDAYRDGKSKEKPQFGF